MELAELKEDILDLIPASSFVIVPYRLYCNPVSTVLYFMAVLAFGYSTYQALVGAKVA